MDLKDFDYNLPKNLIAQVPMKPRDHSRLLVMDRENSKLEHKHFYDIIDYLKPGDVLVLNNTKVFPARLIGKRKETGGRVEIFLLRKADLTLTLSLKKGEGAKQEVWQCLVGGHRRKENLIVVFDKGLTAKVLKNNDDGTFLVGFNKKGKALMDIINKIGQVPLPPYIKREIPPAPFIHPALKHRMASKGEDDKNYQTVYADDKKIGSVAAPTAGFHFTPELIKKLKKKGVQFEYVTLHVGLGTFAPVKVDDITKHKMHSEWVEVKKGVIKNIIKAKQERRRVVAVGTTSVRTLEAVFNTIINNQETITKKIPNSKFQIKNYSDWVNIFIYPGYKFNIIDAMITNFHLPKSTLLMLVSAFAGQEKTKTAYREAVKKKYRFFSYGDAMLIK
jgi:S-adenosylmethionine:tRNA ribosyltransferase-isomerase